MWLNRSRLREVRRREGRYLLRTNLTESDPAKLWEYYLQLVAVEEASKTLRGDLAIRPIFHQGEKRIEVHIFIAFFAYCLHVTFGTSAQISGPGTDHVPCVGEILHRADDRCAYPHQRRPRARAHAPHPAAAGIEAAARAPQARATRTALAENHRRPGFRSHPSVVQAFRGELSENQRLTLALPRESAKTGQDDAASCCIVAMRPDRDLTGPDRLARANLCPIFSS